MWRPIVITVVTIVISIWASDRTLAQETTSSGELRTIISELSQGQPDYDDMDAMLRIAVREQMSRIKPWLQQLGDVVDVRFETTENGVDVYLVQHQRGRAIWQFARSPSGRVRVLYFNAI